MITVLSCPACGAPLSRPGDDTAYVSCTFCGCESHVHRGEVSKPADEEVRRARAKRLSTAYIDAMKESGAAEGEFLDVARRLAAEHLGDAVDVDALTRVIGNLVYDFEAENDVRIRGNALVVGRIVETAFKAFGDVAADGSAEMNLPFLTANDSGPLHYQRKVNAAVFAKLGAQEPVPPEDRPGARAQAAAPAPEEPPPAAEAPQPKKKKGFFSRLFGG